MSPIKRMTIETHDGDVIEVDVGYIETVEFSRKAMWDVFDLDPDWVRMVMTFHVHEDMLERFGDAAVEVKPKLLGG